MSRNALLALAEVAFHDQQKGMLSLIRVIERINIHRPQEFETELAAAEANAPGEAFAIRHPMQVVGWWVRSDPDVPELLDGRLGYRSPEGQYAEVGRFDLDLSEKTGAKLLITLPTLPWLGLGRYWLVAEERAKGTEGSWNTTAEFPLEVEKVPEQ